jgi:hypothetical protein
VRDRDLVAPRPDVTDVSPLFIVGTERSGSNLLRLLLNEHPSIAIPHPPHILKEMVPLEPLYGDLGVDANFRRLVQDVVRLVQLHFSPWDVELDADAAFQEAPGRDVYGVKAAVYDQYRRAKGKRRWGCKSTFVIHHVDRVRRLHPAARFIHLVRDGRDVAASAKNSVFNHFHPHYVGRLWSREQKLAIDLARSAPEATLTVRYEDMLDDPEGALRKICDFLREDFVPEMLRYHEGREARVLADQSRSWKNCAKPVLKENRSKYRAALSASEIRAFERQAFEELVHFGYPLASDFRTLKEESGRPVPARVRLKYWFLEKTLGLREECRALCRDRNEVRRLKKKLFVRWLGIRRR